MLTAVEGVYDNNAIVLNEDIHLTDGQKVIVTILDTIDTDENDIAVLNRLKLKREITKEDAWKAFLKGLDGFTDDFMANGREEFIQTQREIL